MLFCAKCPKEWTYNCVFRKIQNPAENFCRHFFIIFLQFCKNEIPWRMTKTRKNTKFAKKVSFRKLGSERREKTFRDYRFLRFVQPFLPSKPCFTLFSSPEKKTALFDKFAFLQGVWKIKNPCFSRLVFFDFCHLPWNRPTHFLQNRVFSCFFVIFFREKNCKKSRLFLKKKWRAFRKILKWPENIIFAKNAHFGFHGKFGKKWSDEKISKKISSEKFGHFVKIRNFFLRTCWSPLFHLPWVLMKTGKNGRWGPPTVECTIFGILCKFFCVGQKTCTRHCAYTLKIAHLQKMCFAEKKSELDILRKNLDILSKYDIFVVVNYQISQDAIPWRMQFTQKPTTFAWPAVTRAHFGIFCKFFCVGHKTVDTHCLYTLKTAVAYKMCFTEKRCLRKNPDILLKHDIFVIGYTRSSRDTLPWRTMCTQKPTIFLWPTGRARFSEISSDRFSEKHILWILVDDRFSKKTHVVNFGRRPIFGKTDVVNFGR